MIVTLADFRRHARVPDTTDQTDLLSKLQQAEAMVLEYVARSADATWLATMATWGTETGSPAVVTPAPAQVQAAILEQALELYRFRGDDPETVKRDAPGDLSPSIKAKLYRLGPKGPVMA